VSHPHGGLDTAEAGHLADQIALAVAACPAVAALANGPLATYLPGRVVTGVAVRDKLVVVAVVARHGPPLTEVAGQVRSAVAGVAPGLAVDVCIDDLQLPDAGAARNEGAGE
jgi:hypothetical protein